MEVKLLFVIIHRRRVGPVVGGTGRPNFFTIPQISNFGGTRCLLELKVGSAYNNIVLYI